MNVTEFLLARIAEDEAEADPDVEPEKWCSRVLAECAAKRTIMAEHEMSEVTASLRWCPLCHGADPWDKYPWGEGVSYPCRTVAAIAAVYATHPDYDPAWDL